MYPVCLRGHNYPSFHSFANFLFSGILICDVEFTQLFLRGNFADRGMVAMHVAGWSAAPWLGIYADSSGVGGVHLSLAAAGRFLPPGKEGAESE